MQTNNNVLSGTNVITGTVVGVNWGVPTGIPTYVQPLINTSKQYVTAVSSGPGIQIAEEPFYPNERFYTKIIEEIHSINQLFFTDEVLMSALKSIQEFINGRCKFWFSDDVYEIVSMNKFDEFVELLKEAYAHCNDSGERFDYTELTAFENIVNVVKAINNEMKRTSDIVRKTVEAVLNEREKV